MEAITQPDEVKPGHRARKLNCRTCKRPCLPQDRKPVCRRCQADWYCKVCSKKKGKSPIRGFCPGCARHWLLHQLSMASMPRLPRPSPAELRRRLAWFVDQAEKGQPLFPVPVNDPWEHSRQLTPRFWNGRKAEGYADEADAKEEA